MDSIVEMLITSSRSVKGGFLEGKSFGS
jgi:hypothetical protein